MALKIKVGDTVRVIAGKDKDKEGKVLAVADGKVKVEGINIVSRHTKPSAANAQGGIVTQEAFIDASNVMYLAKGEAVRVGFKVEADGSKSRINKKTGEVIDVVKKPAKN
ncbi:MAG: 50S ribosomal protein L24 [Lachnospiraceae bacterium]|jgi:large subunit ribosomal protein L24|nr:50S ribosomal protein L24 [Lachnospiraceae bacterium]MCR4927190.1 50S ribosomal protein L24 [Lachnospiraceae bacterium]